jgi:hypothetical protein
MSCCAPTIFPFNEAVTTVNYSPFLLGLYGPEPNVQVYYRDGTQYVLSDDMNEVKFDGTDIVADHGGVQIGFLKVF